MILDGHRRILAARGISLEIAERARIYSGTRHQVRDLLGYGAGPGLVIPFTDDYGTVRLDDERQSRHYRLPRGKGNLLYWPATLPPGILGDPARRLYLTEGPLKALAATQAGFPCIAVSGVWNWRQEDLGDPSRTTVIPCVEMVAGRGRETAIVFDQDSKPKTVQDVRRAEQALAQELELRDAVVSVIRIPPGSKKRGLDDYLVEFGPEAFAALPLESPDADRIHVSKVLDEIERARRLTGWPRVATDRRILEHALKVARARHSPMVPLYVRSVAKAVHVSISMVSRSLDRLCRDGRLRRDAADRSYFHIVPLSLPLKSSLPQERVLTLPPITVPSKGVPKKRQSAADSGGEVGGVNNVVPPKGVSQRRQVRPSTASIQLLEASAPDPDHAVWDRRALGPQCRRTYRVFRAMGEVTAAWLATLLGKTTQQTMRDLRRLRNYELAVYDAGFWRPVCQTREVLDAIAEKFVVPSLATREIVRAATRQKEQDLYRARNARPPRRQRPETPEMVRRRQMKKAAEYLDWLAESERPS